MSRSSATFGMLNDIDVLAAAISERRAILFAGAGLSMVVGLPSWQALIDHLMTELGLEPDQARVPGVDCQVLAEHYRIERGSIGPLRSWMDREWKVTPDRVRASRIHEIIVKLDYTTNYDRNLEIAFDLHGKPYAKIANAADLTKIRGGGTQIVKFHGDFDDDETFV